MVTNDLTVQSGCAAAMFTMTLNEICEATNAKVVGEESLNNACIVRGINTDSRTIKHGELFVALKGDNFDAHDFISHAYDRGAVAYLLDHEIEQVKPALIVNNTRKAFGQLASVWRDKFHYPVVAVTGSNGKTTVKEMLSSILATQGNVLATKGNFNNDIGVPITLYRMTPEHDSAVIEMGANHQQEISYLTNLVKPDVAIITNAAAAHLEGFGSLEGVVKAKGEIFESLRNNGIAVLNYDDSGFSFWKNLVGNKKIISFGENKDADVSYTENSTNEPLSILINGDDKFKLILPLLGKHNIINALAAIAAAVALNVDFKSIKQGLEAIHPVPGRLDKKQGINNSTVIDDTYNANPASLAAAVEAMQSFTGCYHVVLGDMGELGNDVISHHKEAAAILNKANITYLYTVGDYSKYTSKEFLNKENNFKKGKVNAQHFVTQTELIEQLKKNIQPGDIILVKGSRSMQMENIVNSICQIKATKGGQ